MNRYKKSEEDVELWKAAVAGLVMVVGLYLLMLLGVGLGY